MTTSIRLIAVLLLLAASTLTSCARPQPPGEDIWIGLREAK